MSEQPPEEFLDALKYNVAKRDMETMMEFEYGRGVTGDGVASMRRMANVLASDLRSMNAKWRIDDMTVPEWQIVDGNVEVKFRYDSKRYSEQLRITA